MIQRDEGLEVTRSRNSIYTEREQRKCVVWHLMDGKYVPFNRTVSQRDNRELAYIVITEHRRKSFDNDNAMDLSGHKSGSSTYNLKV
jgi:hypothetical protein